MLIFVVHVTIILAAHMKIFVVFAALMSLSINFWAYIISTHAQEKCHIRRKIQQKKTYAQQELSYAQQELSYAQQESSYAQQYTPI